MQNIFCEKYRVKNLLLKNKTKSCLKNQRNMLKNLVLKKQKLSVKKFNIIFLICEKILLFKTKMTRIAKIHNSPK